MANEQRSVSIFIDIKGDEQILKTQKDIKKLEETIAHLTEGTEEHAKAMTNLVQQQGRLAALEAKRAGEAKLSLDDLQTALNIYTRQLNKTSIRTQEFLNISAKISDIKKEINEAKAAQQALETQTNRVGSAFERIRNSAIGSFVGNFLSNALQNALSSIPTLFSVLGKTSDEIAEIQKTTGLTTRQAQELSQQFAKIDSRTTLQEFRQIAAIGGQLGVEGAANILKFTRAMDKLNIALVSDFGGSTEELTKVLGGLRLAFSDIKTSDIEKDYLSIGNALNVLSAAGAATSAGTADVANRIAGLGTNLGLTSGQILGLAAATEELKISAEVSGTGINDIFRIMSQRTADFAKVLGISQTELKDLVNNKEIFKAFELVISKLNTSRLKTTDFAEALNELGLNGDGVIKVLLGLSKNQDLVRSKIALATDALQSQSSILEEVRVKNETLQGSIERIWKNISQIFASPVLVQTFTNFISFLERATNNSEKLSQTMQNEQQQVQLLTTKLASSNVSLQEKQRIYGELEAINPKIVEGINLESLSYEKLRLNVQAYNNEQINRILLQKQQERLDERTMSAAEAKMQVLQREEAFTQKLLGLQENFNITNAEQVKFLNQIIYSNASAQEKYGQIVQNIDDINRKIQTESFGDLGSRTADKQQLSLLEEVTAAYKRYDAALQEYNLAKNEEVKLMTEREKLKARLGISDTTPTPIAQDATQTISGDATILKANLDQQVTVWSDFLKTLQAESEKFKENLSLAEVIQGIDTYYNDIIAKAIEAAQKQGLAVDSAGFQAVLGQIHQFRQQATQKAVTDYRESVTKEAEQNAKDAADAFEKYYAEYEQAKADAIGRINLELNASENKRALELAEVRKHYENLILEAEKYGYKSAEVREKYGEVLLQMQSRYNAEDLAQAKDAADKKFQAQVTAANQLSGLISATINLIGSEGKKNNRLSKELALAQIAIDTAAALATNIRLAFDAAKTQAVVLGPATPFVVGGYIAAGVASILSGMAQAKSVLKSSNISENSESSGTAQTPASIRGYAKGGFITEGNSHSNGGMQLYNNGMQVAELEGGEMVLSRKTVANNPELMTYLNASMYNQGINPIKAMLSEVPKMTAVRQYMNGGFIGNDNRFADYSKMIALLELLVKKETNIVFSISEFENQKKTLNDLKNLNKF